jgi:hypothetical protein
MKRNVTLHCGNQTRFYAPIARIEVENATCGAVVSGVAIKR